MEASSLLSFMDGDAKKVAGALVAAHDMPDEKGCDFIRDAEFEMDKDKVLDLYQILKDADALDRVRLGEHQYEFDYLYLRTDESKKLPLLTASLYHNDIQDLILGIGFDEEEE